MHDLVIRNGTIVDGSGDAPFRADIAIDDDRISIVGAVPEPGREEIDAANRFVTPGFVDIHTHYDGQATWDAEMAPSSWHGVTTVVMGNCGVGFAPAAPERRDWLIGLMEGVEDIPGTALVEGMTWNWETFPEYLDALEALPRTIDVATMVPHGAVRAYVLGDRERPGAVPTAEDVRMMSRLVEEGVRAGALGFSTSRTALHKSIDRELVPGTRAGADELLELGRALRRAGFGVFALLSDFHRDWNEFEWMGILSRENDIPVSFAALQTPGKALTLDEQIASMRAENARGAKLVAQIGLRGNGVIMSWRGTLNPFMYRPSWRSVRRLPWAELKTRLSNPAFKRRILSEENDFSHVPDDILHTVQGYAEGWFMHFEMDPDFDYEPDRSASIKARAEARGMDPQEYAYDLLCSDDGMGFIYYPILNYVDGNLDFLVPLQLADDTVNSLSDGGAHCGTICDAANTTFLLEHWVRDRPRGERIPLALAVKRQCHDTARLYGLDDRGLLRPGYLADVNVIDMDRIKLGKPWIAFDLPAEGMRLLQTADGYDVTIKSGRVTFEKGRMTGAVPGKLIRGPQPAAAGCSR